jgi:hypothetical protein
MSEVFEVIEVTEPPSFVDLRSGRVGGGAPLALFVPMLRSIGRPESDKPGRVAQEAGLWPPPLLDANKFLDYADGVPRIAVRFPKKETETLPIILQPSRFGWFENIIIAFLFPSSYGRPSGSFRLPHSSSSVSS